LEEQRTIEQLKEHYEIEKELALKLYKSTKEERRTLYTDVYNELFARVKNHPQLMYKSSTEDSLLRVTQEIKNIQPYINKDSTFLEIGAGDCALSIKISELVKTVYAIDVSDAITKDLEKPTNFQLILSDGTSIPIPENSVSFAYSNQLMEHLHPDDAFEQLKNIYKALTKNGTYMCITPNSINGPHDISKYFETVARGFHLKEYSVTELSNLFSDVGFSKVRLLVSLKQFRIHLPVFFMKLLEKLLNILPYSLKKSISTTWLFYKLLGIKMIATK
jgi:ubiquinone/menaquinone biosynthesis C-methylase UbiE